MHGDQFERVLEITRDILRFRELEPALESIARGVLDLFHFRYCSIVLADGPDDDQLFRRVMLGWDDTLVADRKNEMVSRQAILEVLRPEHEVVENCFYIPAENEFRWERAIYAGVTSIDEPRHKPNSWHERDSLCLVLRDDRDEMIGYMSPDGPIDGNVPDTKTLRSLGLFVNLMGLALANARAHRAEIDRRRMLEGNATRLRHEATHDALTGLPNRAFFQTRLANTIGHARRKPGRVYAVLFVDLDEFKAINDSLGHVAGDALLNTVAERMRASIGATDFVARIGGDEFAVVLDDRDDMATIENVVKRIQAALVSPITIDGRVVYNTASIGVAAIESDDREIEDVLRKADTAMYHAKSLGRARHALYDAHMLFESTRRLALSTALRTAIEREQFTVDFQPIIALNPNREITGFEALVRWRHPQTGEVLPNEFIPLAEEVGLIVAIGRYVFVESVRRLAEWRERWPEKQLRMNVNLSVGEILEADLETFIERTVERFGVDPSCITLEITESAILRGNAVSLGTLNRLRAVGVRLSIDDFGTGYSSLRYLHQLPIDGIKIDRSFVESDDGDVGSLPIVRMLIQLGEAYDLEVVAEGVETERQSQTLATLNCRHAQGFHYYRPMSAAVVTALLAQSAVAVEAK